jgi:hypothetical protein
MKVVRLSAEDAGQAKAIFDEVEAAMEAVHLADLREADAHESRRKFLAALQRKYYVDAGCSPYHIDETFCFLMGFGPGPEATEEERQRFLASKFLASVEATA